MASLPEAAGSVQVTHRCTPRLLLAVVGLVQAIIVGLNLWAPGWSLVDLDQEQNVPAYFQSALLAAAALASLDAMRLEARLLTHAGRTRQWAMLGWLGMVGLFGFLALDESLQIHEQFNTDELQAGLKASSPLQGTVVWLLILLPAVVGAVGWLLAWLGARARVSALLVRWGGTGVALWLLSLVLEGTAKSYFIPRDLYGLEVILEETAETLGTTLLLCGIWHYRAELRSRLDGILDLPRLTVPWRPVAIATLAALAVPAAIVWAAVALNPAVRLKSVGDEHLRTGRFEDAEQTYQAALARAPHWARLWDRLGIARFRRGDLPGAAEAFATAGRLDPRSATALNHQGAVLVRQARYGEAAAFFSRAATVVPQAADAHRNLGIALRHLGRQTEAEAAFRRAEALGLSRLGVISVQVSLPADLPVVYLADPRLQTALDHTAAGRIDAAVLEYRRALSLPREAASAHLGLANELLRWSVGRRVIRGRAPVGVLDADVDPVRPSVLFTHWVRRPDGRWDEIETTVEAAALEAPAAGSLDEAQAHYRRALALGAGAAAHLGLALLAREEGRAREAASQLAAARAVDPTVPLPDAPAARGPAAPFAPRGAALR